VQLKAPETGLKALLLHREKGLFGGQYVLFYNVKGALSPCKRAPFSNISGHFPPFITIFSAFIFLFQGFPRTFL